MPVKGLYLTSASPYSGKTFIALGLLDFLTGRVGKIGLFRPLVHSSWQSDTFIQLIQSRFQLHQDPQTMYGCTFEEAREMLVEGRKQELYSLILEKFKRLESSRDFVVCVGTDYQDASAGVELEFNMDMANHLGIPVLPVVRGTDRDAEAINDASQVFVNTLRQNLCEVLAVVVSHVAPEHKAEVLSKLQESFEQDIPFYVLPEDPHLEKPTVREITQALEAEWLGGNRSLLERVVEQVIVAASGLTEFLDQIEKGSLIIAPADRSDIVVGALMAEFSRQFPPIVGLILTGPQSVAPQVQRLLDGWATPTIPVFTVKEDIFCASIKAGGVESYIGPQDQRKIAAAIGLIESCMDVKAILDRVALASADHITPLMFQYELIHRAKRVRKHIVLPEGYDDRVLRAAEDIVMRGVCKITLLGTPEKARRKIASLGLNLEEAEIIDPLTSPLLDEFTDTYYELRKHKGITREMARDLVAEPSYFGTMMAYLGYADGMVSGAINTTANTIRPALEFVKTRPGIAIVSSVFFMCLEDRVLVYGDCAINPDPSAEQLADIAIASAQTAQTFGIEPKVAMLSYSTGESGQGPDVDKVREATRLVKERAPELKIEGPIQYDAAIDADVARLKMPGSEVAGHATVFIFPDLNAGNNAYKAVQRAADAIAIGPVLQGLKKPVNDLSRGALVADIVNTIAITAIQAQLNDAQE